MPIYECSLISQNRLITVNPPIITQSSTIECAAIEALLEVIT